MGVQLQTDLGRALVGADDPRGILRRITRGALHLVDGAEIAAVDLLDARGDLVAVCLEGARTKRLRIRKDSLSGLTLTRRTAQRCDDAESDPRVDLAACRAVGARSLVAVPLLRCGVAIGVLTVASSQPAAFDDVTMETLSELAGFISAVVATAVTTVDRTGQHELVPAVAPAWSDTDAAAATGPVDAERVAHFVSEVLNPGAAQDTAARARVVEVLRRRAIAMVFQPVVDVTQGTVVGVEALARFEGKKPPDVWFAEAHTVGLGTQLELLAIETALAMLEDLPAPLLLGVNASPSTIASPALHRLLSKVDARRVAIEITEHMAVDDYALLRRRLAALRQLGARLSIDDTGSGYAGFQHILALTPEFIKLDRALTRDLDKDPARRALAAAMVGFVRESGAQLVAEGIETEGELAAARDLGIRFAQGYHLGRPVPFATLRLA